MKLQKLFLLALLLLLIVIHSNAQLNTMHKLQNSYLQQLFEKYARENKLEIDYANKPFYLNNEHVQFDSVLQETFLYKKPLRNFQEKNIVKAITRNGNFLNITSNDKKNVLTINPLYHFEVGKTQTKTMYHLNRGIRLDVNLNNKVFISSSFYENLSNFPDYIKQYIDSLTVVPGMGKARFVGNNIEYALPLGFIGYKASKSVYIELGNDKNFIGSGHRSLLLSDAAYSYPYFKVQANFGKFSFMNLWGQFVDASKKWTNINGYDKKFATFNTLSYNGIKNLQFSFFQSIVWSNKDSLGNRRDQEWGYLVPVIFLNTVNFNNGSPDNNLIGLDINYQIKKSTVLYAQFLIDDFNTVELIKGKGFFQNKYGVQLGIKSFKPFNINNAFAQLEFNTVRPYTYANKTPAINYSHYGEVLAHPLGANFKEFIFKANYKLKRFLLDASIVYAVIGKDSANSHWGRNLNRTDYDSQLGIFSFNNKTTQGVKTNLLFSNISLHYLMNPITNSRVSAQFTYRQEKSNFQNTKNVIFSISYSTSLLNILNDF